RADGFRKGHAASLPQIVTLRVTTDKQGQLDAGKKRVQPVKPERRAFSPRRPVTTRPTSGVAQAHGDDGNEVFIMNCSRQA
ncbi:MAG: hypothetical protein ACYDDA_02825, partial [Acidiferrobacteraceae bacterium]